MAAESTPTPDPEEVDETPVDHLPNLRPSPAPTPGPVPVDAAIVMAKTRYVANTGRFWSDAEAVTRKVWTDAARIQEAALREAAGGGWVCIAPDGTLWRGVDDAEEASVGLYLTVDPVVGP